MGPVWNIVKENRANTWKNGQECPQLLITHPYSKALSPGFWLYKSGMLPGNLHLQMIVPGDSDAGGWWTTLREIAKRWTMSICCNSWVVFRSSLSCECFVHHALLLLGVISAGQIWGQWMDISPYLYLLWKRGFAAIILCRVLGLGGLWGPPSAFPQQRCNLNNCHAFCLWGRSWSS